MVDGDWSQYHNEAIEIHDRIVANGWGEWQFRYSGHSISGIMGALYVVTVPKPWVFIPVAASLHATAGLILALLLFRFVKNPRVAMLAALPFIVFPTALLWTAQPLKDGFSIAGFLLFLYAWFIVLDLIRTREFPTAKLLGVLASFVLGFSLTWVAREYLVLLFQVICAVGTVILGIRAIQLTATRRLHISAAILILAALGIGLFIPAALPGGPRSTMWNGENLASVSVQMTDKGRWDRTRWLPDYVDDLLAGIAKQRRSYIRSSTGEGSTIDPQVSFVSATDILKYVPRAIQISLFAPFPKDWFTHGDSSSSTAMRWISSFEMMFAYLMLPFAFFAVWKWRRLPEMWMLVILCGSVLVIHPMFVPNVGTLVRLRYPYFMTLVCLGLAAFLTIAPQWIRRVRGLVVR